MGMLCLTDEASRGIVHSLREGVGSKFHVLLRDSTCLNGDFILGVSVEILRSLPLGVGRHSLQLIVQAGFMRVKWKTSCFCGNPMQPWYFASYRGGVPLNWERKSAP